VPKNIDKEKDERNKIRVLKSVRPNNAHAPDNNLFKILLLNNRTAVDQPEKINSLVDTTAAGTRSTGTE